jgi:glutamate synthase domain-containing protein 1
MCGIAGLIHRGKSSDVGNELQLMLQALKHRGPDSTGYALYADNDGENFIMRFKQFCRLCSFSARGRPRQFWTRAARVCARARH